MTFYVNALDWMANVILDEDDMASNSTTLPASQASLKTFSEAGTQEAKDYADTLVLGYGTTTYIDSGDAATLASAQTYTDTAVGDIVVTNGYLEWDADAYEYQPVPMTSMTVDPLPSALAADFAQQTTDGSGSIGVLSYSFDAAVDEMVLGTWTAPKDWKAGTSITPVLRFFVKSAGSAGQRAAWGLEYNMKADGETIGNSTIIDEVLIEGSDTDYTAGKVYTVKFPAITNSYSLGDSPLINFRLFRDATGTYNTDDFTANAFLFDFGFMYQTFRNGCDNTEKPVA